MNTRPQTAVNTRAPTSIDRWLARTMLAARGNPPFSIVLWNGEEIRRGAQPPMARLVLRDERVLFELLRGHDVAFGDCYTAGRMEIEGDLFQLLAEGFNAYDREPAWSRVAQTLLRPRARSSSRRQAQDNIHHHYDVGNDFFKLWLDRDMQYTCAYFRNGDTSLEEAQRAKMDLVCRKLALRPDEMVVEAGSGWGTFAMFMAEHYGVRVRAFNISTEQVAWAREEAKRRGLEARTEFIEEDYREIRGRYDAFVSVGMLEHIGKKNYHTLGKLISQTLEPHGRGLLHSIGRHRPMPFNAFMEKRIFPGAYPPAISEAMEIFEPFDLEVRDLENLRWHYAKTLEEWLNRFEKAGDRIREMYDEKFLRTFRMYLAGTMMSFRTGSAQLYQILFTRAGSDGLPWNRDRLIDTRDAS